MVLILLPLPDVIDSSPTIVVVIVDIVVVVIFRSPETVSLVASWVSFPRTAEERFQFSVVPQEALRFRFWQIARPHRHLHRIFPTLERQRRGD